MSRNPKGQHPVLIVEDDPDVLLAMTFLIEAQGYSVETCRCRAEAIAVTHDRCFACLIIDQRLGDGASIDMLTALRGIGVSAPAIIISSSSRPTLTRQVKGACCAIVEKPFLGPDLLSELDRLIGG